MSGRTEGSGVSHALIGKWCGQFAGGAETRLNVLTVDSEGRATGYYTFRYNEYRFKGRFEDDELRFPVKDAKLVYRLRNDDTLAGIFNLAGRRNSSRLKRCD